MTAAAIDAGDLDRRIVLQRATTAEDAFGGLTNTWADLATVWAKRTPVLDGERLRADQQGAVLTDRWLVRWSAEVADLGTLDQLVDDDGRLHGIVGVKPYGRRVGLEITTSLRTDTAEALDPG